MVGWDEVEDGLRTECSKLAQGRLFAYMAIDGDFGVHGPHAEPLRIGDETDAGLLAPGRTKGAASDGTKPLCLATGDGNQRVFSMKVAVLVGSLDGPGRQRDRCGK